MKIAIDASRANRVQKTGVEWYAYNVITKMLEMADDDRFILYFQDEPLPEWDKYREKGEFKVLNWKLKYAWTHLRLSAEVRKDNPDVFFVPAHVMPLMHPKNTIITIHDVAFKRNPEIYSQKENLYQEFSVKFACKNASKIITPTEFTKFELIKYYNVPTDKVYVVNHGFTISQFEKQYSNHEIQSVLDPYKLNSDFLLYVGRIEKKKNIMRLIEAYEQFRDYNIDNKSKQLVLVGKPGYGYNHIENRIKISPYKDEIVHLGWVEQKELPILFQTAKIFMYIGLYEGFGLPILESFASKTPVITSNQTANKEIAGDYALLVDPKDINMIAQSINDLFADEQLYYSLVNKAYSYSKVFTWEKCAHETYMVLKG